MRLLNISLDKNTLTRLEPDSGSDVFLVSSSCHLHAAFTCFVPNMGTRFVIVGVMVTMHERQDRIRPNHELSLIPAEVG